VVCPVAFLAPFPAIGCTRGIGCLIGANCVDRPQPLDDASESRLEFPEGYPSDIADEDDRWRWPADELAGAAPDGETDGSERSRCNRLTHCCGQLSSATMACATGRRRLGLVPVWSQMAAVHLYGIRV
jgi:hypothetical protein